MNDSFLLIRAGAQYFAIPQEYLAEIVIETPLVKVPFAPENLWGIILYQGEILPVFPLAADEKNLPLFLICKTAQKMWVLAASSAEGIEKFSPHDLSEVEKSSSACLEHNGKEIIFPFSRNKTTDGVGAFL